VSNLSPQTAPPWIQIDTLVVPPTGVLIFVVPADTDDADIVHIRERLHELFGERKFGVMRAGTIKIACILFEEGDDEN
jgi:hypothetical protein